jgi:hypothetical protein
MGQGYFAEAEAPVTNNPKEVGESYGGSSFGGK